MPRLGLHLQSGDDKLRAGEVKQDVVGGLPVGHRRLLPVESRKFGDKRRLRVALLRLDAHQIVCLRLERVDLALALDEKAKRHRLNASGRKLAVVLARDVLPEERRDLVAHYAVENSPRLLRVNERHVDVARLGDRLENGGLRDLVVRDALERLLPRRR